MSILIAQFFASPEGLVAGLLVAMLFLVVVAWVATNAYSGNSVPEVHITRNGYGRSQDQRHQDRTMGRNF